MSSSLLPYGRQSISEDDIAEVVNVLRGDWLTTGPAVSQFENAISAVSGGHDAVTVTSGTAALHVAYVAAGISPGDEVVTTPMTFVATASGAAILGAKILFADIEEDTALIDPSEVESLVTDKTKIIAAVDYAGQPANYSRLQTVADTVGALTLADAAHSIGGTLDGKPVGDLADITTFSFFPTKNMTSGEGGAVVAKDPLLAQKTREFRNIGLVRDAERFKVSDEGSWHQEVHEFGLNYRLTDIACALGLAQLKRLNAFKARRAEIVAMYNDAFADLDGVRVLGQVPDADPMWHLYPIRILDGRRREIFEKMRDNGIGVQVNYVPVYWHPVFADLGYQRGMCPKAERFYAEELSLPLHVELSDSDVHKVIEVLTDSIEGGS